MAGAGSWTGVCCGPSRRPAKAPGKCVGHWFPLVQYFPSCLEGWNRFAMKGKKQEIVVRGYQMPWRVTGDQRYGSGSGDIGHHGRS